MGNVLDEAIGRPLDAVSRTRAQAIDATQHERDGGQVHGAPGTQAQRLSVPGLARHGVRRPVMVKGTGVAAEKIIKAAQDKNGQEEHGPTAIQSSASHD